MMAYRTILTVCIAMALATCVHAMPTIATASTVSAAAAAAATATTSVGHSSVVAADKSDYASFNGGNDLAHDASNVQSHEFSVVVPTVHLVARTPPENYALESEGIPSRVISVYDKSQNTVSKFLNPLPIVDTIQEHEKYGNTGDKFYPLGRAFVQTYEGFSNLLNRLLDTPVEVAKTVSRGLTDTLNSVGGKLVGL